MATDNYKTNNKMNKIKEEKKKKQNNANDRSVNTE